MANIEGINSPQVTAWMADKAELETPLTFDLITGGHSNLTFRVTDAKGRRWVLRRPPLNSVLATAHDMGREHGVISALADSGVPVPPVVGLCSDEAVNGAPFYVMDFVDGIVARTSQEANQLDGDVRTRASQSLIKNLAKLHALKPEDVGLGQLGKKEAYVARQLRRWARQVAGLSKRDLPLLMKVHAELEARIPEQGDAGIVHGDYRLDNCIIRPDGEVAAVLDWELCTLGDVRADVATLLVYWAEPGDDFFPLDSPPTLAGGFASRRELVDGYIEATGRDFAELDYFVAFSYWRLACILEGVYSRYLADAMGSARPASLDKFEAAFDILTQRAADILDGKPAIPPA